MKDLVKNRMHAKKAEYERAETKRKAARPASHAKGANRWYELTAAFDPTMSEAIPLKDAGFTKGVLNDFLVVRTDDSMSQHQIAELGKNFNTMGLKVLIIKKGVEFLRLKVCGTGQEERLNKIYTEQEVKRRETAKAPKKED